MFKDALRPAWVEVNLQNLRFNIKNICGKVDSQVEVIGVVKADAYGHGAIEISKILLDSGVKTLAVATLSEALALRKAGIDAPIIMLGITPDIYVDTLFEYNIIPVATSYENAAAISVAGEKRGETCRGFVALDTGMGRIGFLPEEESIQLIKKINNLSNFKIKGLFSHFATSDEADKSYAEKQINKFNDFCKQLNENGIQASYKTIANSAATMELPSAHFNGVRPGIILYGCYPSAQVDRKELSIKPVMSVKANIVQLKRVPALTSISYGRKFTTDKESLIGTLTLGYADGYPRPLNGHGRVIVRGQYAPVVGNICMDQCMIDVSNIPDVAEGDEVILMGSNGNLSILADEIAEKTNTINYEIVCAFGQRLPKVYIR